ncbi:MAG: protein-disulfide reductase DsbD family protein [Methyloceanibacter sp.]
MKFTRISRIAARFSIGLAVAVVPSSYVTPIAVAANASASHWVDSTNSKVRIVSGLVERDGKQAPMAGVQLRMNPQWKTYWKNPGDSGVPPAFDWSGSTNLKSAEVLYPAPHRFVEADGWAIGYVDEIVFPVKVTPEREGEPVELQLAFDFGLCKDLCIPNAVTLGLIVEPDTGKGDARLIESFLARVPKAAAPGVFPELSKVDVRLDGNAPELVIEAAFPPGATGTDLFIDAGEVFVPIPKALGPLEGDKQRFAVTFASAEEVSAIKGRPLSFVLVSDQGATETVWTAE